MLKTLFFVSSFSLFCSILQTTPFCFYLNHERFSLLFNSCFFFPPCFLRLGGKERVTISIYFAAFCSCCWKHVLCYCVLGACSHGNQTHMLRRRNAKIVFFFFNILVPWQITSKVLLKRGKSCAFFFKALSCKKVSMLLTFSVFLACHRKNSRE